MSRKAWFESRVGSQPFWFGMSLPVVQMQDLRDTRVSAHVVQNVLDPKEKIVGLFMIQANGPKPSMNLDFETAVMQALIEPAADHN